MSLPWFAGMVLVLALCVFPVAALLKGEQSQEKTDYVRGFGESVIHYAKKDYSKAKWKPIYSTDDLANRDADFHTITGWDKKNLLVLGEASYPGEGACRLLQLRLADGQWSNRNIKADGHYAKYSGAFVDCNKYMLYYEGRGPIAGSLILYSPVGEEVLADNTHIDMLSMYLTDKKAIYFTGPTRHGTVLYHYYEPLHRIERVDHDEESVLNDNNEVVNLPVLPNNRDLPLDASQIRFVSAIGPGEAVGFRQVGADRKSCGPHKAPIALMQFKDDRWHLSRQINEQLQDVLWVWFYDKNDCVTVAESEINVVKGDQVISRHIIIAGKDYTDRTFVRVWGADADSFCVMDEKGNVFQCVDGVWKWAAQGPDLKHDKTSDPKDPQEWEEIHRNSYTFSAYWLSPDGAVFGLRRKEIYKLD